MNTIENVLIAGSGPAGLSAAIYTARLGLEPLVYEGLTPGGQLCISSEVENYPGFPEPISGWELMKCFRMQACGFGARLQSEVVENITACNNNFAVSTNGRIVETQSIIIATGAEAKRLTIPTEAQFYGKGVSGCATCDGPFFRGKKVLVVGGGNTAMQDAVYLAKLATQVTIVHRRDYLRAEPVEVQKVKNNPKIQWLIPWTIQKIIGDKTVTGAVVKNTETGELHTISCDGIFVAIGHSPRTEIVKELVETDEKGFIAVNGSSSKTSMPGVFACGDVCHPEYKQAVVAAGSGCIAAFDVYNFLQTKKGVVC